MDNPNLDYNIVGKENVELEELCCFALLSSKKTKLKSNANHVRKSKALLFFNISFKKMLLLILQMSEM